MTAEKKWKQKLEILKDYIASNREIYIDMQEISIPEHLRSKFYKYFDDIRNTFVNDFFESLDIDIETLHNNYIRSEKQLMQCLKIERIDLPVDLISFLQSPREGMVRWLYNRLFEMIQGKITVEDFEQMAENDVSATTAEMYRLGYETWAIFYIINLLDPDEAYFVELDDGYEPLPGKLEEVAFGRQFSHQAKRIPELIVHSKKLESYVALKMPLAREVDGYYLPYEIPKKMLRDHTGDTSYALDSRVLFLSKLESMDKIPVYANLHDRKIESPDIIIEFGSEEDLNDQDKINQIQNRIAIMKPVLNSTLVLMNQGVGSVPELSNEGPDILAVGFDVTKFQPIIDKLMAL